MSNSKFVISVRDHTFVDDEVAVYDTSEGAVKAILDALGEKAQDWDVYTTGDKVGRNTIFAHKNGVDRILITENAYNTLRDDPFGLGQEYIKGWHRL